MPHFRDAKVISHEVNTRSEFSECCTASPVLSRACSFLELDFLVESFVKCSQGVCTGSSSGASSYLIISCQIGQAGFRVLLHLGAVGKPQPGIKYLSGCLFSLLVARNWSVLGFSFCWCRCSTWQGCAGNFESGSDIVMKSLPL